MEGEDQATAERDLALPPESTAHLQAAQASDVWKWEFKGVMRVKTTLGATQINFSETSRYAPLLPP